MTRMKVAAVSEGVRLNSVLSDIQCSVVISAITQRKSCAFRNRLRTGLKSFEISEVD